MFLKKFLMNNKRHLSTLLLLAVAAVLLPSCASTNPQLGKFREASQAIRDRYDVKLGVLPIPQTDGSWALAGPFIVREKSEPAVSIEDSK
ncbi:MAG: hypothetical protein R3F19_04085 [Verrucomicrobiales bacterium]